TERQCDDDSRGHPGVCRPMNVCQYLSARQAGEGDRVGERVGVLVIAEEGRSLAGDCKRRRLLAAVYDGGEGRYLCKCRRGHHKGEQRCQDRAEQLGHSPLLLADDEFIPTTAGQPVNTYYWEASLLSSVAEILRAGPS